MVCAFIFMEIVFKIIIIFMLYCFTLEVLTMLLCCHIRLYTYRYKTDNELPPYRDQCNTSKLEDYKTLKEFLQNTVPEYIKVVPSHWLEGYPPRPEIQLTISIIFLFICIPGNISQILVFIAYFR